MSLLLRPTAACSSSWGTVEKNIVDMSHAAYRRILPSYSVVSAPLVNFRPHPKDPMGQGTVSLSVFEDLEVTVRARTSGLL